MAITMTGAKELAARLKNLPEKVSKKLMVDALKEGAKEIAAEVIAEAPSKSGQLVASVGIKGSNSGGVSQAKVSAIYYARFLNDGTKGRLSKGGAKEGYWTGKGKARHRVNKRYNDSELTGAIQATHFMSKAAETASPDAIAATAESLKTDIEAAMKP